MFSSIHESLNLFEDFEQEISLISVEISLVNNSIYSFNYRTLDLSGNNIGQLNATMFESFKNLGRLILISTNLIEIDLAVFRNTHNFYEADFTNNQLKRVRITSPAKALGILRLDQNELTKVEAITAKNFPRLWELGISKNQIPYAALVRLKSGWQNLKFTNNPFDQKEEQRLRDLLLKQLGFVGMFISKWF